MSEHSLGWTSNELRSVFSSFDADGSGAISYDEFLLGVRGPMNERRVGLVLRAFAILDADKSGVIEVGREERAIRRGAARASARGRSGVGSAGGAVAVAVAAVAGIGGGDRAVAAPRRATGCYRPSPVS